MPNNGDMVAMTGKALTDAVLVVAALATIRLRPDTIVARREPRMPSTADRGTAVGVQFA